MRATCSSLQTLHHCWGYTRSMCCLPGSESSHSELLPLRALRSRKALGAAAALEWFADGYGGYGGGNGNGRALSSSSTARSSLGLEARSAVSSPRGGSSTLHLSSSENITMSSILAERSSRCCDIAVPVPLLLRHDGD